MGFLNLVSDERRRGDLGGCGRFRLVWVGREVIEEGCCSVGFEGLWRVF